MRNRCKKTLAERYKRKWKPYPSGQFKSKSEHPAAKKLGYI